MLKQLSIFTENTKGAMHKLIQILGDNGINVLASVTNDSAEFGIVRMVVDDPGKAAGLLDENDYLCKLTDLIGVEIEDSPGSLAELLTVINRININVNYLYSTINRMTGLPVILLNTEDIPEVENALSAKGFTIVTSLA